MYYRVQEETVKDIADAIRTKSGVTGEIKVDEFAQSILNLETSENTVAAAESASRAAASAVSAQSSATAAAESAGEAAAVVVNVIQDTADNVAAAQQFAQDASDSAGSAKESADKASDSSYDSEAWAVGQRNGIDVTSEDITYQKNAKYWAQQTEDKINDLDIEQATVDDARLLWETTTGDGIVNPNEFTNYTIEEIQTIWNSI